jgi:UDP-3-O-[3-hydroxymyristoyl] glucosamine N-acyltransferase
MLLSEYFDENSIIKDGEFIQTMPVSSNSQKSICYIENRNLLDRITKNENISCVITSEDLKDIRFKNKGLVICAEPAQEYYRLHNYIVENKLMRPLIEQSYISPKASIHPTVQIASRVHIEDYVKIEPFAIIEEDTLIQKGTYIGHNAVIGCKGMQNVRVKGSHFGILYFGGVRIGQDCEVLCNAIIQKPYQRFFTTIGDHSQVSVKVSIGHGSQIGTNTKLAGNVTVAGNVIIGDNVWIGPSATIADEVVIESDARVLMGSVVAQNVNPGTVVSGNFSQRHEQQLKNFARIKKL